MAKKSIDKQATEAKQAAKKLHSEAEHAEKAAEKLMGAATGRAADFMNFVREQGVVGLAVGLAIGTAAGASVKSIVDNFISPLVALLTRGVDLNNMKWVIMVADEAADKPEVAIGWGAIVSSLITLLATALVIYWVVKVAKLDRLDKKKG